MKEALLESTLRKMRLNRVLPTIKSFKNPNVLDIGCGWEARLLQEIEPYIAKGIGIDFKAPTINTDKIQTFTYYFESKDCIDSNGGGVMLFFHKIQRRIQHKIQNALFHLKMKVLKW